MVCFSLLAILTILSIYIKEKEKKNEPTLRMRSFLRGCGGVLGPNYQLLDEYGNAPLFALIEMEILIEMGNCVMNH